LTAGNISYLSAAITAKPFPGHSSIINASFPNGNQFQGTVLTQVTSDSAISVGQLVYYRAATTRWALADANALATTDYLLGICLIGVGSAGSTISVLIDGIYSSTSADNITTIGDPVYVSETAGNVTGVAPTTASSIVRGVGQVIGINSTTYTINFRPDTSYFTNG
jgi:hypothetical protein